MLKIIEIFLHVLSEVNKIISASHYFFIPGSIYWISNELLTILYIDTWNAYVDW